MIKFLYVYYIYDKTLLFDTLKCLIILHYTPVDERRADWVEDVEARIKFAIDYGKESNYLKAGSLVIIVTGWKTGPGSTNTLRVQEVE